MVCAFEFQPMGVLIQTDWHFNLKLWAFLSKPMVIFLNYDILRPSDTIWDHQRPSQTIRDHTMNDQDRPGQTRTASKSIQDYLRVSESILRYHSFQEYRRVSQTIQDHLRPFKISDTIWSFIQGNLFYWNTVCIPTVLNPSQMSFLGTGKEQQQSVKSVNNSMKRMWRCHLLGRICSDVAPVFTNLESEQQLTWRWMNGCR